MKYIFRVNGIPPLSLNELYKGIHWSDRKKYKDQWRAAFCGWHFKKNKAGNFDATKPVRFTDPVHITYVFRQKKPMDTSNLAFMVKLIEDALATDLVIENDTIKCVLSTQMISIYDKENSVTVILSTVDEAPLSYDELITLDADDSGV